ncbi:MAG TPA: DUF305 domain-containing protein [Longimicrobium sp.]|uniref:DUF305 domain-containing protein n=1 Tax=Longimicrobium sp. TaxID=2029185 RepID=UPI002ED8E890
MSKLLRRTAASLAAAILAACGPAVSAGPPRSAPPAAPVQPTTQATGAAARAYSEADVRFLQMMIPHHAQALEMTALVPSRSTRQDVRLTAQRIDLSQQDEIAMMQRWLRARRVEAQAEHQHGAGHAHMPGMLTPQEMERLRAASGAEFDRLFLEYMIRHHEGALAMVAELFATPGAGQEPELFSMASEVDSDQRMEIARMRAMLNGQLSGAPRN